MTRAEIETEYRVENDIIRSPGKFEGESVMAPYFYDLFLAGMSDDEHENYSAFDLTDDDRQAFPGLIPEDATLARLHHHDNGFITLSFH